MKRTAVLLLLFGVTACDTDSPTVPLAPPDAAFSSVQAGGAIPDRYIVVFRDGSEDPGVQARALIAAHGGRLHYTYATAVRGFAATLPAAAVQALQRNPNVAYIEPDQVITLHTTQLGATWGLDRVDQFDLPLSTTYDYTATGAGVTAYIIDTGIRYTHTDFGGRAVSGFDAVDGGTADDCNGHGTHVAGTVGGARWGVAKGVALVGVRVLDCAGNGTTSGVIAGIDWVTANHAAPAVANMSLGGSASTTLDAAVTSSIAAGVTYAVSAGNGNFIGRPIDACTQSPARVPAALTVGSTTSSDTESSFSNYGTCVDLLAPGSSITSAWYTSDTQTNTISGTSMATPHVTGTAALYLEGSPTAAPATVAAAIVGHATPNTITLHSSSVKYQTPNLLLYTGFIGGGTPEPNLPPTAAFTAACTYLSCSFTDASTDADGSIAAWGWSFGDGSSATQQNPTHGYAAAGTYTVTLMVTDDNGAQASTSRTVIVSAPPLQTITLSVTGYVKGVRYADLRWSGATLASVDVWRNGVKLGTTPNDGAYTDKLGKATGTFSYQVCDAGTDNCSNAASVTF